MGKVYLGSKTTAGLCQDMIDMIPRHDLFLETHLGVRCFHETQIPGVSHYRN